MSVTSRNARHRSERERIRSRNQTIANRAIERERVCQTRAILLPATNAKQTCRDVETETRSPFGILTTILITTNEVTIKVLKNPIAAARRTKSRGAVLARGTIWKSPRALSARPERVSQRENASRRGAPAQRERKRGNPVYWRRYRITGFSHTRAPLTLKCGPSIH